MSLHLSVHVLAAGAAGSMVKSPGVALAVGLASHALLDVIPHNDITPITGSIGDGVIAVVSIIALLVTRRPTSAIAGVGAAIPDIEVGLRQIDLMRGALFFPSHSGMLPHGFNAVPAGALVQVVISVCGLLLLSRHRLS